MKTQLRKSLNALAEAVYQEYVGENDGKDLLVPVAAEKYVALIHAQGIGIDEIVKGFAGKKMDALFRSKRKSLDYEQLLLFDLDGVLEELRSGVTSIGNGKYVTNDMLTWEHLEIRAANQADHITAAEAEYQKTKKFMDCDAARMIKETPGSVLKGAVIILWTAAPRAETAQEVEAEAVPF